MNNDLTLEKLRSMRLFGMHDAFKASLENTLKEQMTQDQFVFHLVSSEWDNRRNRAIDVCTGHPRTFRQHWRPTNL